MASGTADSGAARQFVGLVWLKTGGGEEVGDEVDLLDAHETEIGSLFLPLNIISARAQIRASKTYYSSHIMMFLICSNLEAMGHLTFK